jgi:hypothetical protein
MPKAMGRSKPDPSFFLDVCGCKIDGDVGQWNIVSAISQRGADTIAAFAHGGVGQTDCVKVVLVALNARNVHLNLNDAGINAVHRRAKSFVEHRMQLRAVILADRV